MLALLSGFSISGIGSFAWCLQNSITWEWMVDGAAKNNNNKKWGVGASVA